MQDDNYSLLERLTEFECAQVENHPAALLVLLLELEMALQSKAATPDKEDSSGTILAYGVQLAGIDQLSADEKIVALGIRIRDAIYYFEPRLEQVELQTHHCRAESILYSFSATFCAETITFTIAWDNILDNATVSNN